MQEVFSYHEGQLSLVRISNEEGDQGDLLICKAEREKYKNCGSNGSCREFLRNIRWIVLIHFSFSFKIEIEHDQ